MSGREHYRCSCCHATGHTLGKCPKVLASRAAWRPPSKVRNRRVSLSMVEALEQSVVSLRAELEAERRIISDLRLRLASYRGAA